jgi:hypothetical protein
MNKKTMGIALLLLVIPLAYGQTQNLTDDQRLGYLEEQQIQTKKILDELQDNFTQAIQATNTSSTQ